MGWGRGRAAIAIAFLAVLSAACAPTVQSAQIPGPVQPVAQLRDDHAISFDGARLGLSVFRPPEGVPVRAAVVALHGINDYAAAYNNAGPWWAHRGIVTYAYDARGFGRSPNRGVWPGQPLMHQDMRTLLALVRQAHPDVPVALVGESMGAATIMSAYGSEAKPDADRVVLLAPAVWGWSNLPLPYRTTLWLGAHTMGRRPVTPPRVVTRRIRATDNVEALRAMGRDPNIIFDTRIDVVYGLVRIMEAAYQSADDLPGDRTAVFTGQNDQIVPRHAFVALAPRLPAGVRTVDYPNGWHMLTRDLQAETMYADAASFILTPEAPFPSGVAPFPGRRR
jgi:acylglycerol lipase